MVESIYVQEQQIGAEHGSFEFMLSEDVLQVAAPLRVYFHSNFV